jgi:hypothetical protein
MTTSHLRIVGNMQGKKVVDSVAQQAIEEVLSKIGPFYKPTELITTTQTLPSGITVADVKISNRDCIRSVTAPGYSAVSGISPEDTFWNLSVEVNDSISGAKTVVTQGVRIRLPAGNCP